MIQYIVGLIQRRLASISVYLLVGFIASSACLLVFAAIAEDVYEEEIIVQIDIALANSLHESVTNTQLHIMYFISLFGSQIIVVITIGGMIFYIRRQRWTDLFVWLVAIVGGQVLNVLIKAIFNRPRPIFAYQFVSEIFTSFPSGHAMVSLITYGLIAFILVRAVENLRLRIVIVFCASLMVLLISISRLYLGVHYLSDVVAGMAAGGVWLSSCIALLLRFQHQATVPLSDTSKQSVT